MRSGVSESTVGPGTGRETLFHQWVKEAKMQEGWEVEVIGAMPDSQFLDKVESK